MAAGIPEKRIVYSHALKNAALPIVTVIALSLAGSFGGAIIVEAVFDWPGMGKLYYDADGIGGAAQVRRPLPARKRNCVGGCDLDRGKPF